MVLNVKVDLLKNILIEVSQTKHLTSAKINLWQICNRKKSLLYQINFFFSIIETKEWYRSFANNTQQVFCNPKSMLISCSGSNPESEISYINSLIREQSKRRFYFVLTIRYLPKSVVKAEAAGCEIVYIGMLRTNGLQDKFSFW